MRKSARAAAESPPAATPPQPPSAVSTPTTLRACLYCNRVLPHSVQPGVRPGLESIFCTPTCTNKWTAEVINNSKLRWCSTHKTWTDLRGRCLACKMIEQGYSPSLAEKSLADVNEQKAMAQEEVARG